MTDAHILPLPLHRSMYVMILDAGMTAGGIDTTIPRILVMYIAVANEYGHGAPSLTVTHVGKRTYFKASRTFDV